MAHLSYNHYRYSGGSPYIAVGIPWTVLNKDFVENDTVGAEVQATKRVLEKHLLIVGLEYRNSPIIEQKNYDQVPYSLYLYDKRNTQNIGVYLQDEFKITSQWILNAGVRHERIPTPLAEPPIHGWP